MQSVGRIKCTSKIYEKDRFDYIDDGFWLFFIGPKREIE